MQDIRDYIFRDIIDKPFQAFLYAEQEGILSGVSKAYEKAEEIGILLKLHKKEGDSIKQGEAIGLIDAKPKQMAQAEEVIAGSLAKASGIATAAYHAVQLSKGKIKIVSGSWKKMPVAIKDLTRKAVVTGGALFRITSLPMIYLDKNFIRMFGSIPNALKSCVSFEGSKVVQIKGIDETIETETKQAVTGGCNIIMVDTGNTDDLKCCLKQLEQLSARDKVKVAFAGNVKISDIPYFITEDIDILCIGKEIIDARLLDIRLDVMV